MGELRAVELAAEHAQKAELALENACRSAEALGRETCRQHAAFGGASEVEPFDHRAVAGAREFHEPARQRACHAKRVAHSLGIKTQEPPAGDRASERSGGARRVEAAALVAVLGCASDADHHLGA